jgi:hypothetical protein
MNKNETVWPITRNYLKNEANHLFKGDQASGEALDQCLAFSTWYFAVSDRAELDPIFAMQEASHLAGKVGVTFDAPTVNVFKMARDAMDSFLNGYIQPSRMSALKEQACALTEGLQPLITAILQGKGDIEFDDGGYGLPKVLTDSFYPLEIHDAMDKFVNEKGLVTGFPMGYTGYIKSLIADEASAIARIKPDIHNL